MGNCMASNKVMSQEVEDNCRAPSDESMKQPPSERCGKGKERKMEKKVRFKLEDGKAVGEGGDLGNGNGNGNGAVRRVRVMVTKEELRQILRHTKMSGCSSSCSLKELMVALRSRSEGRINNGLGGNYWRPRLENIPENRS